MLCAIYNSQKMEATYMSINRSLHKEEVLCIHNEIFLSHKIGEILPFGKTWMDPENIMLQ